MKVRIRPSAEGDLSDGFAFYEKQELGLGAYFLDSLFADIDALALYGGIHRRVYGSHRLLARLSQIEHASTSWFHDLSEENSA